MQELPNNYGNDYDKMPDLLDGEYFRNNGPFPRWVLLDNWDSAQINKQKKSGSDVADIIQGNSMDVSRVFHTNALITESTYK